MDLILIKYQEKSENKLYIKSNERKKHNSINKIDQEYRRNKVPH